MSLISCCLVLFNQTTPHSLNSVKILLVFLYHSCAESSQRAFIFTRKRWSRRNVGRESFLQVFGRKVKLKVKGTLTPVSLPRPRLI